MSDDLDKINRREKEAWQRLISPGKIFAVAFIVSSLIHMMSYINLEPYTPYSGNSEKKKKSSVKISIVDKKSNLKKEDKTKKEKRENDDVKKHERIVETKQIPTEAPDKAQFLGEVDHKAVVETKAANQKVAPKAADLTARKENSKKNEMFQEPKPLKKQTTQIEQTKIVKTETTKISKAQLSQKSSEIGMQVKDAAGKTQFNLPKDNKRQAYEQLLNASAPSATEEIDVGYREYIDEQIREGEAIDLNTRQYRFISYFSKVRKAIELAWVYPSSAARQGIVGKVLVSFTIEEDGKVTKVAVKDSSGHSALDSAIVEAIKLASPFAPLPATMKRKYLDITGTFSYVLQGYR